MLTKVLGLDVKASDRGRFQGRASVYGVRDLQGEIVVKGAFEKSIKESGGKIKILAQHNPSDVIGIGTLQDTPEALLIDGRIELELQSGKECWIRLQKGLLDGLSVGYTVEREGYDAKGTRLLKELTLMEISLCTFPANPLARVTTVKQRGDEAELRQLLQGLRSVNLAIRHERDRRDAQELHALLRGLREFRK